MDTLIELVKQGNIPIYLNILVSAIVFGTIVERGIALVYHARWNSEKFIEIIMKYVSNNQLDKAIKFAKFTNHAMSKICYAGLTKANNTAMEISMAIDVELQRVSPSIEKRIASLWALANIATLLGLIGTVLGLIGSFGALGKVAADKRTEFLSLHIAEALYNTAVGLSIAVTCMIGHLIYNGWSKRLLHDLEMSTTAFENFLIMRTKSLGYAPEDGSK